MLRMQFLKLISMELILMMKKKLLRLLLRDLDFQMISDSFKDDNNNIFFAGFNSFRSKCKPKPSRRKQICTLESANVHECHFISTLLVCFLEICCLFPTAYISDPILNTAAKAPIITPTPMANVFT